jgi:hypothetical protein
VGKLFARLLHRDTAAMTAEARLEHPVLGRLTRESRHWLARPSGVAVPVVLEGGREGPDNSLVSAAVDALHNLTALEARARAYALAAVHFDALTLILAGVQVTRPAPEWVRQSVAPSNPAAAAALLAGAAAVALEFTIAGDRNVVDVVCLAGEPVGWEYH